MKSNYIVPIRTETFVIIEHYDEKFNAKIKEYEANGWVADTSTLKMVASYSHGINMTMYKYCIVVQRDINAETGEPIV